MSLTMWRYARGEQVLGPVSFDELKRIAANGELALGDMVESDADGVQMPAGSVPGLFLDVVTRESLASPGTSDSRWKHYSGRLRSGAAVVLLEARETAIACWRLAVRAGAYGRGEVDRWRLKRVLAAAELAAGDELNRLGRGDHSVRNSIATLDERVRSRPVGLGKWTMQRQQHQLLRDLTKSTGTSGEAGERTVTQEELDRAKCAISEREATLVGLKKAVRPQNPVEWRRVAVGYSFAIVATSIVFAVSMASGPDRSGRVPVATTNTEHRTENPPIELVKSTMTGGGGNWSPNRPDDQPPKVSSTPKDSPRRQATFRDDDTVLNNLINDVLGPQSEKYTDKGYKELQFGTSQADIEKVSPMSDQKTRSVFKKLKNGTEVLFSSDGKLVGIKALYSRGDQERSVAMIRDTFGTAEKDLIIQWAEKEPAIGSSVVADCVSAFYHFPETVVVVTFKTITSVSARNETQRNETHVAIFDRNWVVGEIRGAMHAFRDPAHWLANVSKEATTEALTPEKLPSLRKASAQVVKLAGREGVYWSELERSKDNNKAGGDDPRLPNRLWVASCVLNLRTGAQPNRTIVCEYRFNYEANHKGSYLDATPLNYLLSRTESSLAQLQFPPRGEEVSFKRGTNSEMYEWLTSDYRRVQTGICVDHNLLLGRYIRVTKTLDP